MDIECELRCPITADLGLVRSLLRIHAGHGELPLRRLEDLVLAVNEAVTNVLDHGGGAGTVTARTTGERIVVEILDVAGGLTHEHLAAAELDPTASHGYGLWMIQHLCDEVTLEQTAAGSLLTLAVHRHPAAATLRAAEHPLLQPA
ncbi:ATP-binding protein [Nonomuraea candida]|uniref:ATP-binding protein n=1 Tax=Nonomuraea candida TaxID=359159 RepID=UPI0006936C27|nr:ATP-binding protein [Nonomuraea candida]